MAEHVCPVWVGYLLASPLRKLFCNPKKLLRPHVREGAIALDVGCAMGFFSLPLAELVGPQGRVVCVDLQERMLDRLRTRATKAGLSERIDPRLCPPERLDLDDLEGAIDFALAFFVVHETPNPAGLIEELHSLLAPGGRLLVAEPRGHVSEPDFEQTVSWTRDAGLTEIDRPRVARGRTALLEKP